MGLLFTNIYIFILATVLALLEIQIEGQNGWARNLPTWRPYPGKWYARIYSKLMSGKELTGYHLTMFSFVFLIFVMPYFFGLSLDLGNLIRTLSIFFIFIALWDFLWFVLNPFYPLKSFQEKNPNHKKFLWGLPVDYYFSLLASFALILFYSFIKNDFSVFNWWIINAVLFIFETVLIIIFSLNVLDIDNWKS